MNCAACQNPINDKFLLFAINRHWHDECLRCVCCNSQLAELGWTFYFRNSMPLCLRDYIRLFGTEGQCALCDQSICSFEWVMRAHNSLYHLRCFACQKCNGRFCIGERFRTKEGKIFCYNQCLA